MFEAPWAPVAPQPGLIFHFFPEVPRPPQPRLEEAASVWSESLYHRSAVMA